MTLPREVVARHAAAYEAHDFDAFRETLAEDVELTLDSGTLRGRDAVVEFARTLHDQFDAVGLDRTVVAEGEGTVVLESRSRNALIYQIFAVEKARIASILNTYHSVLDGRSDVDALLLREEAIRAAAEQAALRRVATLVARGVSERAVFGAVNVEIARLVDADATSLLRFENDDTVTVVAAWSREGTPRTVGARRPIDPVLRHARDTRSPTRFGPADVPDGTTFGEEARASGVRASVGVPIEVDGRVWGMAFVGACGDEPFPEDTEARIAGFTELVATAIANAQARTHLQRLADEQAALRRVAEAVARGAPPDEVFDLVVSEAHQLLGVSFTSLVRFDPDGSSTKIALHDAPPQLRVGQRAPADDDGVVQRVRRTGRPVRIEDYDGVRGEMPRMAAALGITAAAGAPIVVDGRPWGALLGFALNARLPAGVEQRLNQFARLAGTAVADAQARSELRDLADEQAALRRVAELIARDVEPERVFAVVADEASLLLGDRPTVLVRFDDDGFGTIVADRAAASTAVGRRFELTSTLASQVLETAGVCRVDDYAGDPRAYVPKEYGVRAAVATAVLVGGRVWGMLVAMSVDAPLPVGTEDRLVQFGELIAAAVANAENRAQLRASRARVIATADDARRRLQRDVHDGAQQRLVQTVMTLKLARRALGADSPAAALVEEALLHAERATDELRDILRGILPASLTRGGLRAGVNSLVDFLPLPVCVDVTAERLPTRLETTAYFVVAEALTNVVKHAEATRADVRVNVEHGALLIRVSDDGRGGADARAGSGLTGLADRVEAGEGTLEIDSQAGEGTVVVARLPLPGGR